MFRYESRHFNARRARGGDSGLAKESVVTSTQFSAANTVRVELAAIGQSDLDTIELPVGTAVRYRRLAGRELNLPCCNVFRVTDGLLRDYRTYVDVNPVIMAARSMWFSLVSVQVVVLAAALALYGVNPNFAVTV